MEKARASSSMEPVDQPNSSTVGRKEQEKQEEFIASTSFTGAREDYIFTKGDQGLGFYKDNPLHLRKAAAKAKPMLLKSSTLVKGLQRKPAALPDAKKRKTDSASVSKPAYLKEMDKYNAMNCSSNTQHDRPLVK